jgi:hypothetical protein
MADEDRDKDRYLTAPSISGRNDGNTEAALKLLQEVEMGLVGLNTRSLADETARAALRGLCASWRDLNAQRLNQLVVGAQLPAEITVKRKTTQSRIFCACWPLSSAVRPHPPKWRSQSKRPSPRLNAS